MGGGKVLRELFGGKCYTFCLIRLVTLTGDEQTGTARLPGLADRLGTLTRMSSRARHAYGDELTGSARLQGQANRLGTLTETS